MPNFKIGQQEQGPMAHGGAPNRAQGVKDNTMKAFEQSLGEDGAPGAEMDIIASEDEVCLVYHGSANADEEARTRLLRRDVLETKSAAEIKRLTGAPLLEEVITTFRDRWFNIDLETPRAAKYGPQLVERLELLDRVNFASFHDEHREIAAKTLGDGDKDVGYQRASISGGMKESIALLSAGFNGNQAALDILRRSRASRLQLPYEIAAPKHHAALVLESIFNIDVSGLPPDVQGQSALMDILSAGIFDPEVERDAVVKIQVSAGMVALAEELGYGVDLWTLKEKHDIHRAIKIGAKWLITDDVPYTQQALQEHRAAA